MKLFNTEYRIQNTRYRFPAFTLLEIIIVIAITATMATIGIGYYANISKTKLLDKTAEEIVAYLKYAQQNSIIQKDGNQWGVHFENPSSGQDFYALYTGTTYSSPIEIKYLPQGIEFVIPSTASSADISFTKLTGLLSTGGYKQIILKEISTNQTKNVLSCYQGLISYNIDISVCGEGDTSPPVIGTVVASNVAYGSYVDSPFDLSAEVAEEQGALQSCEYTINGGINWYSAGISGYGPTYTCTKTNISSSDGASLSLNIKATSRGGTSNGSAVNKTVDALPPFCSDNWTDNWTASSSIDVALDCSDARSGVQFTNYCLDTQNTCYPSTSGTSVNVSCGSGQCCSQYVRYLAKDNVNNQSEIYSKRVRQDIQLPAASDNWTDNWTQTSPVNITITSSDGSCSGIQNTYYCVDTENTCSPLTTGTSVAVTCASGSTCTQYTRYYTKDNVNNESSVYSKRVRQDRQAPIDGTLTATPGYQQMQLSWAGFSDSGSGLAASNTYKLVYANGATPPSDCSGTALYNGTSTSYTHTGLTNGNTYSYRACAYDAVGNVSSGATASATLPTQWYCDEDNDGYYSTQIASNCPSGRGSASQGNDCCDSSATTYPGQTSFFTSQNSCSSWDYNCDGNITKTASGYNNCSAGDWCEGPGDCYTNWPTPNCGQSYLEYSNCYCSNWTNPEVEHYCGGSFGTTKTVGCR